MFPCEFCEMFKKIFLYRTPLVAASVFKKASCLEMEKKISIYFLEQMLAF